MSISCKIAVKLEFPRKIGEKSNANDRWSPAVTTRHRCLYNERRNTDHSFAWLYSFSVITDNRMRLVTAALTNPNKHGGYLGVSALKMKNLALFLTRNLPFCTSCHLPLLSKVYSLHYIVFARNTDINRE